MTIATNKLEPILPPVQVAGDYPLVCNLRTLRLQTHQTHDELGAKVQLTRQAIMELEAGRAIPKLTTALKLADVFGISVEDLYMKTGKWAPSNAKFAPAAPVVHPRPSRSPFGISKPRILK